MILSLLLISGLYAQEQAAPDTIPRKNDKIALYLSIIPGGGQIYNHKFFKALIFAGAFTYYSLRYQNKARRFDQTGLDADHRARNDQVWMLGLTWTLGLIDAYVDAQLYNFDRYTIEGAAKLDSISAGKGKQSGR